MVDPDLWPQYRRKVIICREIIKYLITLLNISCKYTNFPNIQNAVQKHRINRTDIFFRTLSVLFWGKQKKKNTMKKSTILHGSGFFYSLLGIDTKRVFFTLFSPFSARKTACETNDKTNIYNVKPFYSIVEPRSLQNVHLVTILGNPRKI